MATGPTEEAVGKRLRADRISCFASLSSCRHSQPQLSDTRPYEGLGRGEFFVATITRVEDAGATNERPPKVWMTIHEMLRGRADEASIEAVEALLKKHPAPAPRPVLVVSAINRADSLPVIAAARGTFEVVNSHQFSAHWPKRATDHVRETIPKARYLVMIESGAPRPCRAHRKNQRHDDLRGGLAG